MTPRACNANELVDLIASGVGFALLDVREPAEFNDGHIDGASPLWRRTLELRLAELVPMTGADILLYDSGRPGDARAKHAAYDCERYGYRSVRWLDGGVAAAQEAGLPVVHGLNLPSKMFAERLIATDKIPEVTPVALHKRLASGERIGLFDVRMPEEYEAGHLPGAASIPGAEVVRFLPEFEKYEMVVVNCAGRTRSLLAAATLRALGATNVTALANGTMGWTLSGRNLETVAGAGLPHAADTHRAIAPARELAASAGVASIDPVAAAADLANPEVLCHLIDVRTSAEYEDHHPSGATWLPGGQATLRADDHIAVRSAKLIFCDDDEARASVTAYWFARLGYTDVNVLAGGLPAWIEAKLPVSTGRDRRSPLGLDDAKADVPAVMPEKLADLISGGSAPAIVDVDTSVRFAKAHVPGAHWIPRGWLECRTNELPSDVQSPIVVTCSNGIASAFASAALKRLGYSDVAYLKGGMRGWQAAGGPVETGIPPHDEDVVPPPFERGEAGMRAYLEWETALAEPTPASADN